MDSVINQDYDDYEYIVVDPGSDDGSREIIESYGAKVIKVFEKDNGPADGLNKGFSKAQGEIFGFVNSDDLLLPETLKKVKSYFEKKSKADVIHGDGYEIDAKSYIRKKIYSTKFSPLLYAYDAVNIVQQATFFRREAFERAGGFNVSNKSCWDAELFLKMALTGSTFIKVHDFLGAFRLYPESISGGSGDYCKFLKVNDAIKRDLLTDQPKLIYYIKRASYKKLKYFYNPKYFFLCVRDVLMGK